VRVRPVMYTVYPISPSDIAIALPIPRLAPVTIAVLIGLLRNGAF
jgi:hypothetical protein